MSSGHRCDPGASRSMVQRLQSTTLQASAHGDRRRVRRKIDGAGKCRVSFLDHHAWTSAEHYFDADDLIATSLWTIGVREPNGDPLDGGGELSKPSAEFTSDSVAIAVLEPAADHANVCRRRDGGTPVSRQLCRTG